MSRPAPLPLAIVIGMGPGLGEALVRSFAAAGYAVAFVARRAAAVSDAEHRLQAEGLAVRGYIGDAGDPVQMDQVHAAIRSDLGEAEVLIYNAARIEPARFVTPSGLETAAYDGAEGWAARGQPASTDYLLECLRSNVLGAHHAAAAVTPAMIARRRGTILLTGGVLAFAPWIEWGVTSMGKAALRSLGHSLAKELRPHNIQVETIAIHGTMRAGSAYAHDKVAQSYLARSRAAPEDWQADYHFKADETDGSDPDA